MLKKTPFIILIFFVIFSVLFSSGCIRPSEKSQRPKLLKTLNATQSQMFAEINRFAQVNSMRAKIDLKFEDNSFAEAGIAEKYKTAPGEIVVQRPANIFLKVQIPVLNSDLVQMTSNGEKFRVAILYGGSGGKFKMFMMGTNDEDYSILEKEVQNTDINGNSKEIKENVSAFADLRPQHFTDAVLVRPTDETKFSYLQSTMLQEEDDFTDLKKSPLRRVLRGYYLIDELRKNEDGTLQIMRRFWFDRVGTVRLARQQIFDAKGEIESDIVYGQEGNLSSLEEYSNLPLEIVVTRPKEKYKMRITYQSPSNVSIGKTYQEKVFVLENTWGLAEVDLDKKKQELLQRNSANQNPVPSPQNQNTQTRSQ